ncbi:MAG: MotA/TolQ/ExbB proton channel family protein [Bdellovibrionaceae bacterium]|nr:MotA/TolQ/ExbB proton channel family protein [Pseudobdellovibrionaceae bacterium]
MNFSSLVGIFLAVGVMVGTIMMSTKNSKIFLDTHAFMIVIGGTLAASLLSFSGKKIVQLTKVFFKKVLGKNNEIFLAIAEIVDLAKGYRDNDNYLRDKMKSLKTPFLADAVEMMTEGGIDPEDLDKILTKRAIAMNHRYEEDAEMFKTLSKFPPAFGLLGAVIGMITLMQGLGGADAFATVGPSMAVALVATMYGIAVANFFFLPLGENLSRVNKQDHIVRQMVVDGIKLIRQKKHPLVVEETLKCYLLPAERSKMKKAA